MAVASGWILLGLAVSQTGRRIDHHFRVSSPALTSPAWATVRRDSSGHKWYSSRARGFEEMKALQQP
eukprot:903826-Amphidinium_carterae.2